MFHRRFDLRQGPGIHDQVVYSGIILEKAHALDIQGHRITGGQDNAGMDGQPDGRASADKRDSSVHDDQVRLDGDVHLGRPLGNEQIIVAVKVVRSAKWVRPTVSFRLRENPAAKWVFIVGR